MSLSRFFATASLAALGALAAPAGVAQASVGHDVLAYTGNSGFAYLNYYPLDTFADEVLESCETLTEESSTFPSDLSDYRLVILMLNSTAFSATDVATMQGYLNDGGTLVLLGETTSYDSGHVAAFNTLLSDLGLNSRFDTSASYDTGCGNTATAATAHPLNAGATNVRIGWSGNITVGSGGTALYTGPSGQTVAVEEGGVVLLADHNLMVDDCSFPAGSRTFFDNLYAYSTPTDCDTDGDGFDDASCGGADCDDCDAAFTTGSWYADADADGFGDVGATLATCAQPTGYVADSTDCDDGDASVHPGADEYCNGVDDDCDATIDEASAVDVSTWYADVDGDGYGSLGSATTSCSSPTGYVTDGTDCNDTDSAIHPGADEYCNGIDDDCDGTYDEASAVDALTWYADSDGDSFGDSASSTAACTQPTGFIADDSDCDDSAASVYPGADEYCNGIDDNCDSTVDEATAVDVVTWYADTDGDAFGDSASTTDACAEPSGYTSDATDCDDTDSAVNPGADETCNGIDDNCDSTIDEATAVDALIWYADLDGDGYGDTTADQLSCDQPSDTVTDDSDCDDTDDSVYPGATETAYDSIDSDCDGLDAPDVDGDGFQTDAVGGDDCDDTDATVGPGLPELADGIDNDCDGIVDEDTEYADMDGDGFAPAGGDCDDDDAGVHPAASETADGIDEDCDGTIDEGTSAYDDDGDGWSEDDGDCDDSDASTAPDLAEVDGDGVDNDCDGVVDDGRFDADSDGMTEDAGDCDDDDATVHPGAVELADGLDNDCDGLIDEGTTAYDDDGDGFSEDDGDCDDGDDRTHPEATEALNGVDDDCNGVVDEGTEVYDDDGDGWSEVDGDCDDDDDTTFPGADEVDNGLDDDCDGLVDDHLSHVDFDGDGYAEDDGDCDDLDPWVAPGQAELCNGVDDNCDGQVDEADACTTADLTDAQDLEDASGDVGKRGCSTTGGSGGLWLALLPLAAVVGRRRKALLALSVGTAACGGVENSVSVHIPELETEDVVDLGDGAVGETLDGALHLRGVGTGEVTIDALVVDHPAFSVGAWPDVVEPGADIAVPVQYIGTAPAWDQGWLEVQGDMVDGPITVELRAHADIRALHASPSELHLGAVDAGGTHERRVWVRNTGGLEETLTGLQVDGPFTVDGDTGVLLPGEERALTVTFTAADRAVEEGLLWIERTHGDPLQVRLTANDCTAGPAEDFDRDGDGVSSCGGDCDDDNAARRPGAVEVSDGEDNDCDDLIDEGTTGADDDGDGWSEEMGDCDDTDAAIHPDAEEVPGDGRDNDCDGTADDGTADPDSDGFTEAAGDCAPDDSAVHPAAIETANGVDDDCDGLIDEGTTAYDDDGDGYTEADGDCDDTDTAVGPGASETANFVDDDCDGDVDEGTDYADDDSDGYTELGGDCDDTDPDVSPADTEVVGDGVDNDCDGTVE